MDRRALALSALSLAICSVALAAPPAPGVYRYVIERNGDPIGTHRTELRTRGDRLAVQHEIDIRVSIAGFEAYRYQLQSAEFWDGDRLTRLTAYTNKNGTPLRVSAQVHDDRLTVSGREQARAPLDAVPASPAWNVLDRHPRTMIDAEDGRALSVQVGAAQRRTIRAGGRAIACRCYQVTGELEAELCYGDDDGVLVRKTLEAPDGSTVREILR